MGRVREEERQVEVGRGEEEGRGGGGRGADAMPERMWVRPWVVCATAVSWMRSTEGSKGSEWRPTPALASRESSRCEEVRAAWPQSLLAEDEEDAEEGEVEEKDDVEMEEEEEEGRLEEDDVELRDEEGEEEGRRVGPRSHCSRLSTEEEVDGPSEGGEEDEDDDDEEESSAARWLALLCW